MSSIHCLLGLPWWCKPSILPSKTVCPKFPALPLVTCPKYCSFIRANFPINSLSRPISSSIDLLVRCSFQEIPSIFLQQHCPDHRLHHSDFQCRRDVFVLPDSSQFNCLLTSHCYTSFNLMKLIPQKLEGWGYCTVKISWSYLQPFFTNAPVCRVTDGRTALKIWQPSYVSSLLHVTRDTTEHCHLSNIGSSEKSWEKSSFTLA